jgi:hypothetical protein
VACGAFAATPATSDAGSGNRVPEALTVALVRLLTIAELDFASSPPN